MSVQIELKETKATDSIKKVEVIREVAQLTGMSQADVRDVLDAFTDIAQREIVVNGAWRWPGLPNVKRSVRKNVVVYNHKVDKTLIYPEQYQLTTKLDMVTRKLHKDIVHQQMNLKNGTTDEDFWKPYFFADGDKRKEAYEYLRNRKKHD